MKKILVIEDSPRAQELIKIALEKNYELIVCDSTLPAKEAILSHNVDLILLDVNMPNENGIEFLSSHYRLLKNRNLPIIFLTANNDISYKISAFKLGAADYVVKPFEPIELQLRIEARLKSHAMTEVTAISPDLYIDHSQCLVFQSVDQQTHKIDLSLTEYKLVCFFTENPHKVFSRDQIFDRVWGENTNYLDRTIDRHISSLKKKIPYFKQFLKARYGIGYIFQPEPTLSQGRRAG